MAREGRLQRCSTEQGCQSEEGLQRRGKWRHKGRWQLEGGDAGLVKSTELVLVRCRLGASRRIGQLETRIVIGPGSPRVQDFDCALTIISELIIVEPGILLGQYCLLLRHLDYLDRAGIIEP